MGRMAAHIKEMGFIGRLAKEGRLGSGWEDLPWASGFADWVVNPVFFLRGKRAVPSGAGRAAPALYGRGSKGCGSLLLFSMVSLTRSLVRQTQRIQTGRSTRVMFSARDSDLIAIGTGSSRPSFL